MTELIPALARRLDQIRRLDPTFEFEAACQELAKLDAPAQRLKLPDFRSHPSAVCGGYHLEGIQDDVRIFLQQRAYWLQRPETSAEPDYPYLPIPEVIRPLTGLPALDAVRAAIWDRMPVTVQELIQLVMIDMDALVDVAVLSSRHDGTFAQQTSDDMARVQRWDQKVPLVETELELPIAPISLARTYQLYTSEVLDLYRESLLRLVRARHVLGASDCTVADGPPEDGPGGHAHSAEQREEWRP